MEMKLNNNVPAAESNQTSGESPVSYIRVLHASPGTPPIDVVANGGLIARSLKYKSFTSYLKVVPGNYNIKIYPTGNMTSPVLNTNIKIPPYSILTLIAGDNLSDLKLFVIPDNTRKPVENRALVRFAHLSPKAPDVNVDLRSGIPLFNDVEFGEYTNYVELPPDLYHFIVRSHDTGQVLLSVPNANLKAGKVYTIYLVGEPSRVAPLEALIPLDGSSYIKF